MFVFLSQKNWQIFFIITNLADAAATLIFSSDISEAAVSRPSAKQVFLKLSRISQKSTFFKHFFQFFKKAPKSFFNKNAGLQPEILLKWRLHYRYFSWILQYF